MASTYIYTRRDCLRERNTYFYAGYHGRALLRDWRLDRARLGPVTATMPPGEPSELPQPGQDVHMRPLLGALIAAVDSPRDMSVPEINWLAWVLKKFEVSKRLFPVYGADLLACNREDYRHHDLYVRAAELMERAYRRTSALPFLNCLLKIDDTIVSLSAELPADLRDRAARVLAAEGRFVGALAMKLNLEVAA